MKIEDLVLKQTCECCPEQYDVIYNGDNSTYELALEDALKYALENLV